MEEVNGENILKLNRKVRINVSSIEGESAAALNDVSSSDSDESTRINEATNESESLDEKFLDIKDKFHAVVLEDANESKNVTEDSKIYDYMRKKKKNKRNIHANYDTEINEVTTKHNDCENVDDAWTSEIHAIAERKLNFMLEHSKEREDINSHDEEHICVSEEKYGKLLAKSKDDDDRGDAGTSVIENQQKSNENRCEEFVTTDNGDKDDNKSIISESDICNEFNFSSKYDILEENISDIGPNTAAKDDETCNDPLELADASDKHLKDANDRKYRTFRDSIKSKEPDISEENAIEKEEIELKVDEEVKETPSVSELINSRALSKHATTYELEKFGRNALIIFNQENIDGYYPRLGTRKDAEALTTVFGKYGFEIEEHLDFTRDEIFRELKKFSEQDFTDHGCVAVAILTHGSDMGELKAKDRKFYEMDVMNFFKTQQRPTLVTKPKIIIIQACRGSRTTQAMHVMRAGGKITQDRDDGETHYTLPVEADTLVIHSTYVGNTSHRDETHGSWFIQTLCKKINELADTQDLESIMIDVKRDVAINKVYEEFNRRTMETDYNKQMPVLTSTLIRKLYLKSYKQEADAMLTDLDSSIIDYDSRLDKTSMPSISQLKRRRRKTKRKMYSQEHETEEKAFVPCDCFLDRFQYMRDCMRHFVEGNPVDDTARSFLNVAEVLGEGPEFNVAKREISKAIKNHLHNNAKQFEFYKYLYFYGD